MPSRGLAPDDRARRRQTGRGFRIHGAGNLGQAGDRRVLARRRDALLERGLVDVGEAHPLHRVQVVEVAPELLEAVRRRQRLGVVAQVVLAELAGVVAEIEQELGERRRAGPQLGRAAGQLRRDHAGAQRMHAGEEGVAPGGAALLGVVVHEDRALVADAVDVRRLPDHQAAVVDARLHPADVVAHDEQDVGFLLRRRRTCHQRQSDKESGNIKQTFPLHSILLSFKKDTYFLQFLRIDPLSLFCTFPRVSVSVLSLVHLRLFSLTGHTCLPLTPSCLSIPSQVS